MPNNPSISCRVAAYIDPELNARLMRMVKAERRLSTSLLVEECIQGFLPTIERRVLRAKARKAVA